MVNVQQVIRNTKTALLSAKMNPELLEGAIQECGKNLKTLNNSLKNATNLGQKNQLANGICMLTSFRSQLKMLRQRGQTKTRPSQRVKWECMQSAFKNRMRTFALINLSHTDLIEFLKDCQSIFSRRIKTELKNETALKVNAIFCGEFINKTADTDTFDWKYMNTKNCIIYDDTNIAEWFKNNIESIILKDIEEFQEKESGWALSAIINLRININKYTGQLGSSYIPLPEKIAAKKACINVENDDNACFVWAVLSAKYSVDQNPQRISNYRTHYNKLNLTGIQFPMTTKQIPRFEQQNNVSVNIYILEINKFKDFITLPTYLTKNKQKDHVNLLMIQNDYWGKDKEDAEINNTLEPIRYHYVWIKDLSRLLSTQLTSVNRKRKYFCDRCLHYFYSQVLLDHHIEACTKQNSGKIRLPNNNQKNLKFKNHKNKIPTPYIIYADLECILQKTNDLYKYQNHIPCSLGYYVKCSYDENLSYYKAYRGVDCVQWFTTELRVFAENLDNILRNPLKMEVLTEKENSLFNTISECHICEKPFNSDKRVRDHCHFTGKFRGAAHNDCNLNYKDAHTVPVVFHNLSGYDSHFIIENIASDLPGRVDLLPLNMEKYISFTKHIKNMITQFRFIDSYRFMGSGLDTLASYLISFPNLKSQFASLQPELFNLLKQKGVYPYDYMDSTNKFLENSLPPHTNFFNKLNETNISNEQYTHAQEVWRKFNLKNLGEYSDLYLKTDVILLADVFEQFRSSCLQTYQLDPAHYFTLPGYTWDSMLKHTDINLELLTDIDMIMFVERGIRGG